MDFAMKRPFASALSALVVLAGPIWSCGSPDPDPYQPLSQACDDCLLRAGPTGCGDNYDECESKPDCEDVVLCELLQQCYTRPSGDGCSSQRGCREGASETELALAAEFEDCARSVCAADCDFVE